MVLIADGVEGGLRDALVAVVPDHRAAHTTSEWPLAVCMVKLEVVSKATAIIYKKKDIAATAVHPMPIARSH